MQEQSDAQLLRACAAGGHESAFRELIARHADLVYSAALRQVGSRDLACDVAQRVFTDLAGKAQPLAARMTEGRSLVGWLYRSTRFAALNLLRDDRRRLAHERQAMEQLITNSEPDVDWERMRPALDEAMAELSDDDREALLLRYFKNHDLRAVGQALGVSDAAAQKRVSRAVERLREFFAKRGIAVGASALVAAVSANAVHAAPVGLTVTISAATALAGTTIATTTTATVTQAIAMTTLQKTLVTITVAVLAGAGIYEGYQTAHLRNQNKQLVAERAQLISERDAAVSTAAQSANELAQRQRDESELLRLRSEVGTLRRQTNELAKLQKQAAQQQRAQISGPPSPGEQPNSNADYVARHQYAFAGYADPESAIKSMHWAASQGDVKNALASMTPEAQIQMKTQWAGKTDAEISTGLMNDNDIKLVLGYRIAHKEMISGSEMVVTVYQEGRSREKKMRLERIGNEWKYAGPPRGSRVVSQ